MKVPRVSPVEDLSEDQEIVKAYKAAVHSMETPNDIRMALYFLAGLDTVPIDKRVAAAFLLGYAYSRGCIDRLFTEKDLMDVVDTVYEWYRRHREEALGILRGGSR